MVKATRRTSQRVWFAFNDPNIQYSKHVCVVDGFGFLGHCLVVRYRSILFHASQ